MHHGEHTQCAIYDIYQILKPVNTVVDQHTSPVSKEHGMWLNLTQARANWLHRISKFKRVLSSYSCSWQLSQYFHKKYHATQSNGLQKQKKALLEWQSLNGNHDIELSAYVCAHIQDYSPIPEEQESEWVSVSVCQPCARIRNCVCVRMWMHTCMRMYVCTYESTCMRISTSEIPNKWCFALHGCAWQVACSCMQAPQLDACITSGCLQTRHMLSLEAC
jgi:hypothetical protein